MKKSMALLTLVALVFVTCTGCAAVYIEDGRTMGYAIGKAEVKLERTADAGSACIPADQNMERTLIYSSHPVAVRRKIPATCNTKTEMNYTLTIKGGNLGAGWFGAITTFLMLYFAPIAAVI